MSLRRDLKILRDFACLIKLKVHTITEKHNHYLAVRCPYAQRHTPLNKAISTDKTFLKFELAPHDYTLCTRSCKRHMHKWNAKTMVMLIFM